MDQIHRNSPVRAASASEQERYQKFKEKFGIQLNAQQEQAVQAVDGANLLLAVPGSGKTTVLVARLGYMIWCKGIRPDNILAVTFSKQAARDMERRFACVFGTELGRVEFRTINAIAYEMVRVYAERTNKPLPTLLKDNKKLITDILRRYLEEYPTDSEIAEAQSNIGYIKNMSIPMEEISQCEFGIEQMDQVYGMYQATLKAHKMMDYDDQVDYALRFAKKVPWLLELYRRRFHYICVDEAQDTSKIQHELIRLLVGERGNIFLVGDEDQSIYRFRGAYPQALLDFHQCYPNTNVLWMETNYRSSQAIVDTAARFIAGNRERYPKQMVAHRAGGYEVESLEVGSRKEQYAAILEVARTNPVDTAVIYRDNDSALPLLDLFVRYGVPYRCHHKEIRFFTNKVVLDVLAFMKLQLDPCDVDSFRRICYKGGFYLDKKTVEGACSEMKWSGWTVLQALKEQARRNHRIARAVMAFEEFVQDTRKLGALKFLRYLDANGYGMYMEEHMLDYNKFELLIAMADDNPPVPEFLERLERLRELTAEQRPTGAEGIILTTAHSSKGLEYDTVYLIDVFDGQFPTATTMEGLGGGEAMDALEEERRLFYVAITRAKNHLYIFEIAGKASSFADVVFQELRRKERAMRQRIQDKERERTRLIRTQAREDLARDQYLARRNEVLRLFVQQDTPIYDSAGVRWVQCRECGQIKESREFRSYGGNNCVNLGECTTCARLAL